MPLSVAKMLKTLTNSNDCQFIYRKHINGESSNGELNDYCQSLPSNHSHILFYLNQFSGAEKLIKQSVSRTLSNVQNAKVKLLTVSYPENFIKTETSTFHDESLIIRGESCRSWSKWKQLSLWVVNLNLHGNRESQLTWKLCREREGTLHFPETIGVWEMWRTLSKTQ